MRKAAILFISTLALLIFVAASLIQSLLVIQRVAAVSEVRGLVRIRPQGENAFVPLGGASHVRAGDVLQTAENSGLTLNWVDGSRIRVGPGTTMTVLACQFNQARRSDHYLFRLDLGQLWVRVLKSLSEQSKFEIQTPTATAGVRGTVFSVAVRPDGATQVAVYRGTVNVGSDAERVAVDASQTVLVTGSAQPAVRSLNAQERRAWHENRNVANPSLTVSEPRDGRLRPGLGWVAVRGVAERGSQVTVNGQPVPVRMTGKFETRVEVPRNATGTEITVRARDKKGFETVVTRHLER